MAVHEKENTRGRILTSVFRNLYFYGGLALLFIGLFGYDPRLAFAVSGSVLVACAVFGVRG